MRKLAACAIGLMLLASCSEGADVPSPAASPTPSEAPGGAAGSGKDGGGQGRGTDRPRRRRGGHMGHHRKGHRSSEADRNLAFEEPAGEDDNSSAIYPAAGAYLYSQKGEERFCQGAACSREPLPARERVRVTVREAAGGATVVSEASSSRDRVLRTTATYTRQRALITDVYSKLVYQGFAIENSYHPQPPVVALRLPLKEGDSWSGRWRDRTSGTYSTTVLETEAIEVGGASVGAVKLSSVLTFDGEFEGEAKTLVWIDPATKATVKTSGTVELTSNYGRYEVDYSNLLRSGPAY